MTDLELHARTAPRNITVDLDPVEAIQTSLLLKEIEDAHTELDAMRLGLLSRLREAIEASLDERYPMPMFGRTDEPSETDLRAQWGDR